MSVGILPIFLSFVPTLSWKRIVFPQCMVFCFLYLWNEEGRKQQRRITYVWKFFTSNQSLTWFVDGTFFFFITKPKKMWFSQDMHWSWVLDTQFDTLEMGLMSCITRARGRQAETNNWRKQKKVQLAFFICNVPLQNPKRNALINSFWQEPNHTAASNQTLCWSD